MKKGELNKRRKNICARFPNIKWKQYPVNVEVMFQQIAMYPAKRNGTKGGEKKEILKSERGVCRYGRTESPVRDIAFKSFFHFFHFQPN